MCCFTTSVIRKCASRLSPCIRRVMYVCAMRRRVSVCSSSASRRRIVPAVTCTLSIILIAHLSRQVFVGRCTWQSVVHGRLSSHQRRDQGVIAARPYRVCVSRHDILHVEELLDLYTAGECRRDDTTHRRASYTAWRRSKSAVVLDEYV